MNRSKQVVWDQFAIAALEGLATKHGLGKGNLPERAAKMADEMMMERKERYDKAAAEAFQQWRVRAKAREAWQGGDDLDELRAKLVEADMSGDQVRACIDHFIRLEKLATEEFERDARRGLVHEAHNYERDSDEEDQEDQDV